MNDKPPKSKLPDLEELKDITVKFFGDVKNSICEIYDDFQQRHDDNVVEPEEEVKKEASASPEAKPEATREAKTETSEVKKPEAEKQEDKSGNK